MTRYHWTPELRDAMREAYRADSLRELTRRIDTLVRRTGWPRHAIRTQAVRMGLSKAHGRRWTAEERAVLEERLGSVSAGAIARQLGRSLVSVQGKAAELGLSRRIQDGYHQDDLALCFGVDVTTVGRWMRRGLLGKVHHANGHRVTVENVTRFIRRHPAEYDLRRVDQTWFKGMVFGGF